MNDALSNSLVPLQFWVKCISIAPHAAKEYYTAKDLVEYYNNITSKLQIFSQPDCCACLLGFSLNSFYDVLDNVPYSICHFFY